MLNRISAHLESFSRAERQVADYVLEHPRKSAKMTLSQLAIECGTSEPTVIRFCRRLGLNGFRDLILRLTEALSQPVSYLHQNVNANDSTADAAVKVLDASIQSLVSMRAQLSALPLEAAVDKLASSRQIAFAGLGASGQVARDACHKFFRLGIPCTTLTDSPMMLQFSAIATTDDALVIISHSGSSPQLQQAARQAKDRGATVLVITTTPSELSELGSLSLFCPVNEDTSLYTPMTSRLSQLVLLDAIQVALALKLGESAAQNLRLSKDALLQLARL